MSEFIVEPNYMSEEEMGDGLGRLLWGKNGGKFSLRRLIFAMMKKRLRGKKG